MINQKEFVLRLKKIMTYYNENATSFSEKIGVQRSSISHILSERNKPSLEFILKVLSSYQEINLYWLLNGQGYFLNNQSKSQNHHLHNKIDDAAVNETLELNSKHIEKIIVLYKDGRFKHYQN
ncbi:helix-turn-helix domain-containing protein, partial [Flavobacteriaceae bacterium]|jgi:transcriptional regulator with XRE-family HTH domain|nr:helix-turn-helix domain-containing protein [Flavobacteriaceae bacterium]